MIVQTMVATWVALTASLDAQERQKPIQPPPAWRIAPEVSHYRYREPGVMTNEGTLYGVVGSYTFYDRPETARPAAGVPQEAPVACSTFAFDGRIAAGQVDYDGSFMDGTPLSNSGIDDFLLDVRLLWGRHWEPARIVQAAYAGLGYRYLCDDSSGKPGGYQRESNYLYLPVGVRKGFDLTGRWDLTLTGELDMLLVGRQISHLSDANPDLPDVRNWQWPGLGATLSADFLRRGPSWAVGFSPFLRYWWVDESDLSADGYYEPRNNTFEYGLSFVVRF
ncbi:MAG: hypothetical protein GX448_11465 [Planctomycetes bacterium]|nr:hypothetical protein [Planctomycetota bacterium]